MLLSMSMYLPILYNGPDICGVKIIIFTAITIVNMNIVITGATKGIGKALAAKFLSEGHHVILNSSQQKNIEALRQEFQQYIQQNTLNTFVTDMGSKADILAFCNQVVSVFDRVDVLVNNAGVFIPGKLSDTSHDNLFNQLNINLMSAYYCTRGLIEDMIKIRSGHIVNICSVASLQAYPNGGAYSVSKFALLGFGKCLREELMPYHIRVTNIMPGATLTDSWAGTDLPQDRFIDVHDLAQIIYTACTIGKNSVVEDIVVRPLQGDI